jgi:hypothetical protein
MHRKIEKEVLPLANAGQRLCKFREYVVAQLISKAEA